MKLPSLHYLLASAKASFLRFPFTLLCAFIGVGIGIYLTERHGDIENIFPFINLLLCAGLGIPLFFCVAMVSHKLNFSKKLQWIITGFAGVILVCIYLTLPGVDSTHNTSLPYVKYAIYNITIHLFVSYLPFVNSGNLNGYWQYNKILFLRLWISALYSAVLYIGLAMALLSLKLLFDISIHDELFFEIFLVVAGILNTWFFLSAMPSQLDELDTLNDYPKGLKIFSQYILLPILALFLIILYVYGGKIMVLWHWPKGVVSYLIISISVLGVLTFLLLHPYHAIGGNAWIRKAARGYYIALLPLLIILFLAIGMRISDYGITISRYMILLLGIWLSVLCLYTAIGKTNIRFIPASLAIMLALVSFGPWGMFSTSERAQVNRLQEILENAHILKNGKILNEPTWTQDSSRQLSAPNEEQNDKRLNDSLHNEVYSILNYLDDHHGFQSIRPWYSSNIDSMINVANLYEKHYNRTNEASLYMRSLGLKPEKIYKDYSQKYFTYQTVSTPVIEISNYDYIVRFDRYLNSRSNTTLVKFALQGMAYELIYTSRLDNRLLIKNKTEELNIALDSLVKGLHHKHGKDGQINLPPTDMQLSTSGNKYDFTTSFQTLGLESYKDSVSVNSFSGYLLIRKK